MGGGVSIDSSSPYLATWKAEAEVDPKDFTNLSTEKALKDEIIRLRTLIRKQVNMVAGNDDTNAILDKEIETLLDKAAVVEAWLTPLLQSITSATEDCELTGLQFKFKSFHSLKRKIQSNLKMKTRLQSRNKDKGGGLDIAATVAAVSDSLRYTILIPVDKYTETISNLRQKLEETSFKCCDFKNYWSEGDMYQGINDVFTEIESKLQVEIQYHTPASWKLKSDSHVIYEKFRICSEPLKQQELFAEGVALAATLCVPKGVMELPTLTMKSAPQLLDAYATQIVTACMSIKKPLLSWCEEACPQALRIEAAVDSEDIIGLELSSLMAIRNTEITTAVKSYYDGFKISVICKPENYVSTITSFCTYFKESPQYITTSTDAKHRIQLMEARNTYDKNKFKNEDVEGVCLHMSIGSGESTSVYDNILFHLAFYTPDSLETEKKVEFLSRMLVTNPSINCVNDEIHELWLQCADPPGAANIEALSTIPDFPF